MTDTVTPDADQHALVLAGHELLDKLADAIEAEPKASIDGDAITQPEPMDYVRHAARLQDVVDQLDAISKQIGTDLTTRKAQIKELRENGKLPKTFTDFGRTVFVQKQLWAGPAKGPDGKPDHEKLAAVLAELELVEFLPKTVNSQSFSSFVREHLDPDDTKPLDERLLNDTPKPLDPRLYAAISANLKEDVRLNKATS